nr:radical SAM protein [Ramlibacter henchirensis]
MTTRCNAACPMCSRNERGGFQIADLPQVDLTLLEVQRMLPPHFIEQLEQVWLCGNYGDPIIAPDTLEVLTYLKAVNPKIRLGLNTNGSARKPDWWQRLARVLDHCHFGIDGLSDTNHLYRRRTHWNVIMANAAAFIDAGGAAHWEFIVFRHNEHQISEAQELARTMGFRKFRLRKTGRFFFDGQLHPALDIQDTSGKTIYSIEPPIDICLRNASSAELGGIASERNGYANYLDTTLIECKAQTERELYISAEGLVFPCCYLASWYRGSRRKRDAQFQKLLEQHGGRNSIDARLRPIGEIIEGGIYRGIVTSWSQPSVAQGRLATCSGTCGGDSPNRHQYTNAIYLKPVHRDERDTH